MASTVTRRRLRRPAKRESAKKVADLTTDELKILIEATIEDTLTELLGDPDAGLELRPEVVEQINRQRREYAAGKHGRSLEEVVKELRLE